MAAERPVWALRTNAGGAGGLCGERVAPFLKAPYAVRPCRGIISVCWPSWSL